MLRDSPNPFRQWRPNPGLIKVNINMYTNLDSSLISLSKLTSLEFYLTNPFTQKRTQREGAPLSFQPEDLARFLEAETHLSS